MFGLGLSSCSEHEAKTQHRIFQTAPPSIALVSVVSGLAQPIFVTHAGDERLIIVERVGRIRILRDGALLDEPYLDITALVRVVGEGGLLSVAFHPNYNIPETAGTGLLWVNYTDLNGDTVIARYTVASDNPDRADPASARILLSIGQPFSNHNGGQLQFEPPEGPEMDMRQYLYIGMGDGGSGGDPNDHGQRDDSLLGKMLRIDPSTEADPAPPFYTIPGDNPRVGALPPLDTIWAKGLRNPFRFSFDAELGDLYIADVGQNRFEEVHVTLAGTPGGINYGWRIMEGLECFNPRQNCDMSGLDLPVVTYAHDGGRCAIIGGYVYRGMRFSALLGTYLYADLCSGEIFGLAEIPSGQRGSAVLLNSNISPRSFGEDINGELYITDDGNVFQIIVE